jgi:hypothetical protein
MEDKKNFYITIALGFLVFLVMLLVVYLTVMKKPNVSKVVPTKNVVLPEATKYKGYLELRPEKDEYKLGEQIVVDVLADSDNQTVFGFDLVVNYDPTKLKFISNTVTDQTLQSIVKKSLGAVNISAFKGVDGAEGQVYTGTEIAKLNFAPIKAEKANISLKFAKNKTDETNLLNDTLNEDTLTRVINTSVIIK